MSRRLALLALLVLCVGLVPAAIAPARAAAQSAGDEQYEDPFAGGNGGGGGSAQPQPAPAQPATPQPATTPVPAGATATSGSAAAAQSGGLPRTGAPVGLIALSGVLLLAGGLALRRHVRAGA
jgi:LPXTG-motif cell wall-anchored protein